MPNRVTTLPPSKTYQCVLKTGRIVCFLSYSNRLNKRLPRRRSMPVSGMETGQT